MLLRVLIDRRIFVRAGMFINSRLKSYGRFTYVLKCVVIVTGGFYITTILKEVSTLSIHFVMTMLAVANEILTQ